MKSEGEKVVVGEVGEPLEIILDDSEKDTYKITLPLSYNFEISSAGGKGKKDGMLVSSMETRDTRTLINVKVTGAAPQLKLKVVNPWDRSSHDSSGETQSVPEDDSGDNFGSAAAKFVDWFMTKNPDMDKETEKFVRTIREAKREIIIRKEVA
jgi:hypothetical protein